MHRRYDDFSGRHSRRGFRPYDRAFHRDAYAYGEKNRPWTYARDFDGARYDPWRRAYDAAEPGPRRRRTDRPAWRERWERMRQRDEERGWTGRARELLRRYREPIIGLTMAGAAAPLAKGAREPTRPVPSETAERLAPTQQRVYRGGVEEEVGERWAATEAEQVREDTIEGAMVRYGIARDLAEDIYDQALTNDIDPDVAFGLVNTESRFDERAISNVGARGLTQVMPRTGAWLRPGTTAEDLYDRSLNLNLGFGYLRDLIDQYDGDLRLALLAYNRGPGTVDRVLRQGGDPNNGYADMVLSG